MKFSSPTSWCGAGFGEEQPGVAFVVVRFIIGKKSLPAQAPNQKLMPQGAEKA